MSFANRLKELRKQHKLTQKQLADILFLDQTSISYWENGKTKPDFENQQLLADYFNVTIDYLLGREEKPVTKRDEPNIRENVVIFNRNGKIIKKEFTEEEMNIISTMLESLKGAQNEDL